MGIFRNKYIYTLPERLSPEEARQRRFKALLEKERKALEVEPARLSSANKFHLQKLKEFESKFSAEIEARRVRLQKSSVLKSNPEHPANSRLFQLLQWRSTLQQRAAAERRARVFQTSVGDRRFYNPNKNDFIPKTRFGTNAWLKATVDEVARRMFHNPTAALPCIQRTVRREVMFARGHGGRGHKVPHRRNPLSDIWC
jgi:hypothetical protein